LRRLIAFSDGAVKQPAAIWANQPSAWRQPGAGSDLIILTRRDWFSAVDPLRIQRQNQGLSVSLVDIEDVFDEFNFGNKNPQAIKDFILYARNNWRTPPRFVLIVGDASLDPKNYLGFGDFDVVPTRLLDTQLMETASDDWLADSNGDGIPEVAVGRLPARTSTDAAKLVAKIIGYESAPGSSAVLLVSDSNSGYDFESASASLRNVVPAGLTVQEIDRGQLDPTTAKAELISALNSGMKIVNYNGHGNVDLWRGNLLTGSDAASLTNASRLPLFVSMTCLNGYFQDPVLDSLAESLLKADKGGAIAVWASSGMTVPTDQQMLNQEMLRAVFDTSGGRPLTVGEAVIRAKSLAGDLDVRRTWILFGDPSMRLK
jgi:hypothetical protein